MWVASEVVDDLRFDKLYRYDELMAALDALAAERPDLVTLECIGRSHEGREIRLATVTNERTGPHDEKPAVWVDANIHSTEVTGSTAALHLLNRLVTGHGSGLEATSRSRARRHPHVLRRPACQPRRRRARARDPPTYLRSSVRAWPRTDEPDGLVEGDIDGDGRILTMRVVDANGAWKIAAEDARLMVPRAPDESGPGPYYRLLAEGTIRNYDGVLVPTARAPLARPQPQLPGELADRGRAAGRGPVPVVGARGAHDHGGRQRAAQHLRVLRAPHVQRRDPASVRRPRRRPVPHRGSPHLQRAGQARDGDHGYKAVSVFHDFRYDPKDVISGAADMWAYEHLGVFGWTTEFWSPLPKAGITDYHFVNWFADHPIADDIALLRWNDEALGGRGYVAWYPFDHPQLGPVEIGGWDWFNVWGNAPPELMEAEIAPHSDFGVFVALTTPGCGCTSPTPAGSATRPGSCGSRSRTTGGSRPT